MGDGTDGADGFAGVAADADLRVDEVLFDDEDIGAHAWLSRMSSTIFLSYLVRNGMAWQTTGNGCALRPHAVDKGRGG
jgi:hypothetical protein